MLIVCGGDREHCVFMISFEQRLTVVRVVEHEILLEELRDQLGSCGITQEQAFPLRKLNR